MNKQLQADDLNFIKTKSVISAFMSKLLFFKRNFARGELSQFQSLAQARNEGGVSEADVEFCREHLQALHDDFTRRFQDILSMVISDWVISPLTNVDDEEISLQEELLELQSNVELKPRLAYLKPRMPGVKHKGGDDIAQRAKKRRALTIGTKMDIVERGERIADVGRAHNLNRST
ncbi:hypothetical protein D918_10140, partial [Trichuris suis]